MTSKCRSCKYLKIEARPYLQGMCKKGQFKWRDLAQVNQTMAKCSLYRGIPQISENKYQKMIRAKNK